MFAAASALLVGSTIADCEHESVAMARTSGGGVLTSQSNLTLKGGSRIERCTADDGGAILAIESDVALLEGSALSDCYTKLYAPGLRVARFRNCPPASPPHSVAGACSGRRGTAARLVKSGLGTLLSSAGCW